MDNDLPLDQSSPAHLRLSSLDWVFLHVQGIRHGPVTLILMIGIDQKLLFIRKEKELEKLRILLKLSQSQKPGAEVHIDLHVLNAAGDDLVRLLGIQLQLLPQNLPNHGSVEASLLSDLSNGQGLVTFNQNLDRLDVVFRHHSHLTARFWLLTVLMNTSSLLKSVDDLPNCLAEGI